MAVHYRRPRVRQGPGIGERLSEHLVIILIVVGIVLGLRWYFVIYRNSASAALQTYVGAVKAGDVETQFKLLSKASRDEYGTQDKYTSKWKLAQGLQGRLKDFTITRIAEHGDTADADVKVAIRKEKLEIYQSASEDVEDKYILVKEADGWRVALEKCADTIKTQKYVELR